MIDPTTRAAFADELSKIAGIGTHLKDAIHRGWHGTTESPQRWMGEGLKITPEMGRMGRAAEHVMSLGGATKYLPVGGKSMAVLGAGMMLPHILSKQDPSMQGKSRIERGVGYIGNTLGGLAAGGLMIGAKVKNPLALMGGGMLGSVAGERLLTSPFALARRGFNRHPRAAQSPLTPNDGGWQNTAPGGLNTTPNAVVGQAQAM